MLTLPGFQITEEIYRGPKSTIFRGHREHDGCPVLFKTTHTDHPALIDLARLQHEYALTNDWNEPGLIRALALLPHQQTLVLILQDIAAISLKQLLQQQTLPLVQFLTLGLAFAKNLECLHQHRIIHKNINPSNLVVNLATGQTQIIDFAIASRLSREMHGLQHPRHLEGTLAYLSPEQTGRMNRSLDYRSDFYSLGATFYEMLSGQPPFAATDPLELVHCHLAVNPRPLHDLRPELPPGLSALVEKLMAKTAEARYQSAFGLSADLELLLQHYSNPASSPEQNQSMADFVPGRYDSHERFQIPQKLYGRENEVAQLLAAFERVSQGRAEMLLVAGYSGVGKSALINEVHKPITGKKGFFIAGKCEQFQRDIPHASLIEAFAQLLRQLLGESPARIEQWKTRLDLALGANAQVIIEVIPEVELILGPQSAVPALPPLEASNRFQATFLRFIDVFAQAGHPLVLFLDDLQWADSATLRLLAELLLKSRRQALLVLGAYRENEIHAAHPFELALNRLRREQANFSTLSLQPLGFADLERLVQNTLTPTKCNIAHLAHLVLHKTLGNPFFVNAFLTCLYEAHWLSFNAREGGWQWNITHIEAQQISDNVVELMGQKLRTLPMASQELLVRAACIGHQFDLATLAKIVERTPIDVMQELYYPLNAGLVQQRGAYQLEEVSMVSSAMGSMASYRFYFIHDRVRQAAYALLSATETAALHLKIGRLWLRQLGPGQSDEALFAVVNQLQAARGLIDDPLERVQLAQLHLQASRKANAATAFASALNYLRNGMALLNGGDWAQHYELTMALSLERAQCESANHQHEMAERYFKSCLLHAKTALEKAKIHLKRLELYGSQNDYQRTMDEGLAGLACLGIRLPRKPWKLNILQERWKERRRRRGQHAKALLDGIPLAESEPHQLALRLLSGITPFAFSANPALNMLAIVKGVNYVYQHGATPDAAYILMCFSSLVGSDGQYTLAWDYAQKALQLSQNQSPAQRCQTLFLFAGLINHWHQPLATSLPYFDESKKLALETGNWLYASLNATHQIQVAFGLGMALPAFKEQSQTCHTLAAQLNDPRKVLSYFRFALDWANTLTGVRAGEEPPPNLALAVEQACANTGNATAAFIIYVLASFHEVLFGNLPQAAAYLQQAQLYRAAGIGLAIFADYFFLDSLCLLGNATSLPLANGQQAKKLSDNLKKLDAWARQCPHNFAHKYLLVTAEVARLEGRTELAAKLYAQAGESAHNSGFDHQQALICDYATRFYLALGNMGLATKSLKQARALYAKWGAHTKVQHLEAHYPELSTKVAGPAQAKREMPATDTPPENTGTLLLDSKALDLATVMKASQAISGEIVLGHLLEKLMRIVIESAGAQHGALLLETAGQWRIEAEGKVDPGFVCVLQGRALETVSQGDGGIAESTPNLPISLIQYVARTEAAVVLDHACAQGQFINDPYIRQHQARSVLCTPILHQGKLVGMLYLANRLIEGAFTADRLEVLKILSSQAAISIENARVYENLEALVAQRTAALTMAYSAAESARSQAESAEQTANQALAELRATQGQLIESKKMASLGQLVAGVAHELNTPIGNALTMASALVDAGQELTGAMQNGEMRKADFTFFMDNLVPMTEVISRSCERAATLITSFKQVAVDQTSEQRRQFDLKLLVDDNIAALRTRFNPERCTIQSDIPEHIECDSYPGPLGQVIANLVQNAIQHAFDGCDDRKLAIHASVNQEMVQMRFTDNGNGMDAEILAQIFEPFYTTCPGQGGPGLGLSISLNIVSGVLGGTLLASSVPGQGSEFTLNFPLMAVQGGLEHSLHGA
jgi:predicted ATPase/signal transduction histidine kinase